MNTLNRRRSGQGFTLIELMFVVVILGIAVSLVAPSFRRMIEAQRVKSINSQLVTDLQLARSEAASRNIITRVTFGSNAAMTCYTIYNFVTGPQMCNCTAEPACVDPALTEIKTVRIPASTGVSVRNQTTITDLGFDPVNGALYKITFDVAVLVTPEYRIRTFIDAERTLRTTVGLSGRPTVCAPLGSKMQEPAC